ncbi:hypothetical protein [Flavobacterium okayamense]|nr:hypothetical protein [Flavobacterium okayamense]
MKKYLFIIIAIFCFINVCSSQIDEKDIFSEIISSNINENDSIHIEIKYREQIGCLGNYVGKILINVKAEKLIFCHISSNPKRKFEGFQTANKNILKLVRDFEINGKKSKKRPCGTILAEQHGFEIYLKINDKETEFTFCKFEYDGLDILLQKLVSLKEKN